LHNAICVTWFELHKQLKLSPKVIDYFIPISTS
jgi:hypothetical protein